MDWINSLQQYTKEDWLKEIRKDNPSAFNDIIEHRVREDINGLSFATQEDIAKIPLDDISSQNNQEWLIGASIKYYNSKETKDLINVCLNNGIEHLIIECESVLKIEDIEYLLKDVYTELIRVEFRYSKGNISKELILYTSDRNCVISQECNSSNALSDPSILQIHFLDLHHLENINLSKLTNSSHSRIILNLGKDFLFNIAFIRGVKKALHQLGIKIPLETSISIEDSASRNNLIDYSLIALSAAIEKPDSIVMKPHYNTTFNNDSVHPSYKHYLQLQHILKSESFLNKITDPVKGSYYLEDLSHKICSKLMS